jgi:hypothetical protein
MDAGWKNTSLSYLVPAPPRKLFAHARSLSLGVLLVDQDEEDG